MLFIKVFQGLLQWKQTINEDFKGKLENV